MRSPARARYFRGQPGRAWYQYAVEPYTASTPPCSISKRSEDLNGTASVSMRRYALRQSASGQPVAGVRRRVKPATGR